MSLTRFLYTAFRLVGQFVTESWSGEPSLIHTAEDFDLGGYHPHAPHPRAPPIALRRRGVALQVIGRWWIEEDAE